MKPEPALHSSMLAITINNRRLTVKKNKSILEACKEAGIYVPTLCYDERLEAYGGCRLCLIEIKGVPRPVTACTTPVSEGMEITTESETLRGSERRRFP
jgi:NADH dehydrogenase/NADH:ubiquinone oxidoreductase subunit G